MKRNYAIIASASIVVFISCSTDSLQGTYAQKDNPHLWFDLKSDGKYSASIGDFLCLGEYVIKGDTVILGHGNIVGMILQENSYSADPNFDFNLYYEDKKHLVKHDTLIDDRGVLWLKQDKRKTGKFVTLLDDKIKSY